MYAPIILLGICALLLISVIVVGTKLNKSVHLPLWLGKRVQKISAKVISIETKTHTTKSFETLIGYQLKCTGLVPNQSKSQVFYSSILHTNPVAWIGENVDVYISASDPTLYVVNTDKISQR